MFKLSLITLFLSTSMGFATELQSETSRTVGGSTVYQINIDENDKDRWGKLKENFNEIKERASTITELVVNCKWPFYFGPLDYTQLFNLHSETTELVFSGFWDGPGASQKNHLKCPEGLQKLTVGFISDNAAKSLVSFMEDYKITELNVAMYYFGYYFLDNQSYPEAYSSIKKLSITYVDSMNVKTEEVLGLLLGLRGRFPNLQQVTLSKPTVSDELWNYPNLDKLVTSMVYIFGKDKEGRDCFATQQQWDYYHDPKDGWDSLIRASQADGE